ncbi:MAG: recombinase, partial [Clostridiales bacterium]|nr:recombinase [Clostridiales bacterium]
MVAGLIQKCINENAVKAIDQDEYISRYNALVERHEKAQSRYDNLQKKRERRLIQADIMSGFLFAITELDTLQLQFAPTLWYTTVDYVTIFAVECLI